MSKAETLITAHLDTWTSAVKVKSSAGRGGAKKLEFYGIKKLRELILELAVQGLLVPQVAEDESADKLLKRIKIQREQLIRSGKIKNAKVRPNENFSFQLELPKNWESTSLGDIGDWGSGSTPKRDNPTYYQGSITWLKSGELNDCETVSDSSENISEEAFKVGSFRENKIGDVLIAMYGATIGKAAILAKPAVTNQAVCGCTPFEGIFNRFLFIYLMSKRAAFHAASEGGAQPNISKIKLLGFPFPLPPLAEQHRIVAKVDELMALCDQLEQQQEDSVRTHASLVETLLGALTAASERGAFAEAWQRIASHFDTLFTTESSIEQLKQTILQLAVMGKLVDEGSTWNESALEDVAAEIVDCPHSTPKWTDEGEICVRTNQFKAGCLDLSDSRFVSEETYKERIQRLTPKSGDILYSREGGILGIACSVPPDTKLCLGQRMMLIRAGENLASEFLELVLNSPLITEIARRKTTGGAAPRVNVSTVKAYPIPLPPLAEQHRIVAKVDELVALCDLLKARLQSAQATKVHIADTLVEAAIR